jgi:hypothetical protein
MKKLYLLKIWLKGKPNPIELATTHDVIMDFTDFANDNTPTNMFTMRYKNRNNHKWLVIMRNQVQAFEFDEFDLMEVVK